MEHAVAHGLAGTEQRNGGFWSTQCAHQEPQEWWPNPSGQHDWPGLAGEDKPAPCSMSYKEGRS